MPVPTEGTMRISRFSSYRETPLPARTPGLADPVETGSRKRLMDYDDAARDCFCRIAGVLGHFQSSRRFAGHNA